MTAETRQINTATVDPHPYWFSEIEDIYADMDWHFDQTPEFEAPEEWWERIDDLEALILSTRTRTTVGAVTQLKYIRRETEADRAGLQHAEAIDMALEVLAA